MFPKIQMVEAVKNNNKKQDNTTGINNHIFDYTCHFRRYKRTLSCFVTRKKTPFKVVYKIQNWSSKRKKSEDFEFTKLAENTRQ